MTSWFKKVATLFCALIVLGACSVTVNREGLDWAEKVCANNGGLRRIESPIVFGPYGTPVAICNNGAKFRSFIKNGRLQTYVDITHITDR